MGGGISPPPPNPIRVKPLVVSPLKVVPKANGSPRLIHDFSMLIKFIQRSPSVKHSNLLNLFKSVLKNLMFVT